jgi:hypothetical protein
MHYSLSKSLEILERTPLVLELMLTGLSKEWTHSNEGDDTWSAYDVVGHLIHGEKTDWMGRTKMILAGDKNAFPVFDRFAMFEESKGKTLNDLIHEFKDIRKKNIEFIRNLNPDENMLDKKGIHPKFGEVTLRQLLSTWTAHDLGHIGQIVRVMAKQYKDEAGPWVEYLRILRS